MHENTWCAVPLRNAFKFFPDKNKNEGHQPVGPIYPLMADCVLMIKHELNAL